MVETISTRKVSVVLWYNFQIIKTRILSKAEELSRKYGFRAITMDELATQLGISKKTIYQYYADKNALVDDVLTTIISKSQEQCQITSIQATNAIDEIFLTMNYLRNDLQNLNPIVIHDLEKYFPDTFSKFQQHKNSFTYTLIYNNLVKGMSQGYYRQEINPEIIAKFRIETMIMGFNQTLYPSDKYSLTDVTQAIFEHFLYGIVTPKGLKLIEKYKTNLST